MSDGSWKDPHGSAAFIVGDIQRPSRIEARGAHLTPQPHPHPLQGSSYRSEIGGLLGGLTLIKLLDDIYQIPTGGATLASDSLAALKQVFGSHTLKPQQSDYDLLTLARSIIGSLPHLQLRHRHVYGHQDEHTPFTNLNRWAQWNVLADDLAKQFLQFAFLPNPMTPHSTILTNHWQLWSSPHLSWSSFTPSTFHYHCSKVAIRSQWIQKRSVPPHYAPDIDWAGIASAMSKAPLRMRRWVVKFNAEQCGVAATLVKWQQAESSQCPRCPQPLETTSHVLQCHGEQSDHIWSRSLRRLAKTLYQQRTDPALLQTLLDGLRQWRQGSSPQCHSSSPLLAQAFQAQSSIGWENALRGFISHQWQEIQAIYQRSLHDNYAGTQRWVRTLIRALWNTAWDQWEHRNAIVHSPHHRIHQTLSQRLDDSIRQEYRSTNTQSHPTLTHLLSIPLSTLLAKPLRYRKHWFHCVETARRAALSTPTPTTTNYHPERKAIRHWLQTGRIMLPST